MRRLQSNLKIGARIDGGHFGEVFLAHDDVHGEVAVKIVTQRPGESQPEWQARRVALLKEGQRLKRATHRNVVPVFHAVESDASDAVHLVMEYCRGGSLQKAFKKGPMQLGALRKIATEISFGLQALHASGMLHRDIKPGNIMLDERGVAKLGDFGLVTDDIILGYGSQAGYSDHIAFEVWNGSGTSVMSDVWAVGMTLYRLLHGEEWYSRGPAPRAVVRNGGFSDSLSWLPHIPSAWRRCIRKMLNDDHHSRHQNANEVISALATLPTEPKWKCKVEPAATKWERKTATRRIRVVWEMHSPRKYEWSAWSEPLGAGNRRTLGGSVGRVSYSASEKELRAFFATQA